jgi:hypothetical protein
MAQVDDALRDSLVRLVPARREEPEWDDILKRLDRGTSQPVVRPRGRVVPLTWLMPTTALVATLVVVVLVALSPWSGSPSVLSKAEAAIAVAAPGQVLYERAEITSQLSPVCLPSVPHGQCKAPSIRIEVWVEGGTGTRHFRAVTRDALPPGLRRRPVELPAGPFGNALERHTGRVILTEVGGVLGRTHVKEALVFRPPNTLVRFTQAPTAITSDSFDPVALVRQALSTGHAHVAGTTTIEHRRLRVIEVRLNGLDGYSGEATYYVDRKTYAPFRIVYHHVDFLQFPFSPVFDKSAPAGITVRFLVFRQLSATPALRAQTDITKMHKRATTICGVEFGLPDC